MKADDDLTPLPPLLKPILPSQYDRFSFCCVQDSPVHKDIPVQCHVRSRTAEPDHADRAPVRERLIHPEGGVVYTHKQLVSDRPILVNLQSAGNDILGQCSKLGLSDVTVFLRQQRSVVEYYVAAHPDETVIWIGDHRPDEILGLTESRAKNMLSEEYRGHMEAIPGSRHVSADSVTRLKNVLSSLAIDSATSDGSTSPFSYDQIQEFLRILSAFNDKNIDEHQTYAVARIWNMVWHARAINNYGSTDACLDRFTALSNNPPAFTVMRKIIALIMLGAAERNLARCSRAWAGRVAYVGEWRQFKAKNETEWQQVIKFASILAIASLLLLDDYKTKLSTILSTLLSLSAAAYGHHLVTESQNLGSHAADASVYFQNWEKPDYDVQRIAIRNATPQALLGWAFIAFVGSVTRVI